MFLAGRFSEHQSMGQKEHQLLGQKGSLISGTDSHASTLINSAVSHMT